MGALKEHLQYFSSDSWIKGSGEVAYHRVQSPAFISQLNFFPPSSFSSSTFYHLPLLCTLSALSIFPHPLFLLSFILRTPHGERLYIWTHPKKGIFKYCMEILQSHITSSSLMSSFKMDPCLNLLSLSVTFTSVDLNYLNTHTLLSHTNTSYANTLSRTQFKCSFVISATLPYT